MRTSFFSRPNFGLLQPESQQGSATSQPQLGAAASAGSGCFATTSGLDVTTSVTTFVTHFVKQAKRAGVDRARSNHGDCQKSRNDYTTHRDISMDLGFGKVLPRLSRNTSERPKGLFRSNAPIRPQTGSLAGRPACGGACGTPAVRCYNLLSSNVPSGVRRSQQNFTRTFRFALDHTASIAWRGRAGFAGRKRNRTDTSSRRSALACSQSNHTLLLREDCFFDLER